MDIMRFFRNLLKPRSDIFLRAFPGGRTSLDSDDGGFFGGSWVIAPPANYEENWRLYSLDTRSLDYLAPQKLMEVLADLSPELSRAIWDYLRTCNPGWEVKALRPKSDVIDQRAQDATLAFLDVLDDRYGSVDVVFGRVFLGIFLQGAACAELVLDKRGRMPIDLATPNPVSIRFRKIPHPELGSIWQPGQWQGPNFIPLDIPTFRYIPLDPFPSTPYGRPIAAPALFVCLFLIGMLHDLRRIVRQQGYPRLDIEIDTKSLIEKAPGVMESEAKFNEYVQGVVSMVRDAYSRLRPDDAFIHTDLAKMNPPVGALGGNLNGISEVIDCLERMAIRALKTMPFQFASAIGSTEGESNRQFELYAQGIKSLQHYVETMLERLLGLALQAQGMQATIEFRFAEMRAAEQIRDAQTEAMRIANERAKYDNGWTSQDEASEAVTGHAADSPAPRTGSATGGSPEPLGTDGDGQEALVDEEDEEARRVFVAELREAKEFLSRIAGATNGRH